MPLNELKTKHRDLFEAQAAKYQGREELMSWEVPTLGCRWNDVLHFSPIHPQTILDTWRHEHLFEIKQPQLPLEVYKVPLRLFNEENLSYFQSFNSDYENYDSSKDKFWKLECANYSELTKVSAEQIELWKSDVKANRRMLWFGRTLHVLAKQRLDTRLCETVVCR